MNVIHNEIEEVDEAQKCRYCGTPTRRRRHTVHDGNGETGPYTVDVPECLPCFDKFEAWAQVDPPCPWCHATEGTDTCCPEAADYAAYCDELD